MDEELHGFTKKNDFERFPISHPVVKTESAADTILSRFVQKVGQIFNRQPEQDATLVGRIQELENTGSSIVSDLIGFKNELEKQVDPDLYSLIVTILDPLIKEVGRFPLANENGKAQQVKVFSRYVDVIEKGRKWIEIGKQSESKEKLEKSLIQQIATEFLGRIDRDIQVIQDYLSHVLSSFTMSDSLKNEVKDKLMPGLSLKLQELNQLKTLPSEFCLKSFIEWRSNSDLAREAIFGIALHIIDEFANEFLPSPQKEKEGEHLQAIVKQMAELENNINKIAQNLKTAADFDENQRKAFVSALQRLEVDAHELNANLHLSLEHSERIENLLETLLGLHEDLHRPL